MKNICQTCILDLRFGEDLRFCCIRYVNVTTLTANNLDEFMFHVIGLPSQLRDAVLSYADSKENSHASTHESDVTRDYKMQEYLQNPTARNNQDESDNRLIKIARAVAEQRHQHRITVSAQPCTASLAMNPPITSIKSHR